MTVSKLHQEGPAQEGPPAGVLHTKLSNQKHATRPLIRMPPVFPAGKLLEHPVGSAGGGEGGGRAAGWADSGGTVSSGRHPRRPRADRSLEFSPDRLLLNDSVSVPGRPCQLRTSVRGGGRGEGGCLSGPAAAIPWGKRCVHRGHGAGRLGGAVTQADISESSPRDLRGKVSGPPSPPSRCQSSSPGRCQSSSPGARGAEKPQARARPPLQPRFSLSLRSLLAEGGARLPRGSH